MDNLELMKQEISNLAKEKKEEFEKVSDYIFANPELAFKEYKSQEALCKLLESHGFVVKRGIAEMPTSFEAVFDSGKPGKTVALMGEYDCLPEIGHGCGHNLIGTSAAGAGIVLKEVMEKHEIGGVLKVLGTPAEEKGSGKAIMVRHGVFEGIDAALLMHPCDESMPDDISFAAITLEFTFKGKPAHAAACPWKGANALSGVQLMFHAVDMMRLHFKDYSRVHGIITEGGVAHNTITDETVVLLSHKKPDGHINVKVEFGEGEGKVPLDNIAKRAESYKPKERVTYKMIKEYIEAKYGFKVHTAYIAEVKRDLGLPMYDAPNAVEELKQPRKHPTPEKVEAIKDALKHFEVI